MRLLFFGDIVGKCGRQSVARWLPGLQSNHSIDLTIANGENTAGGLGATPKVLAELFDSGVDVVTMGNHTWRKRELVGEIEDEIDTQPPAVDASG